MNASNLHPDAIEQALADLSKPVQTSADAPVALWQAALRASRASATPPRRSVFTREIRLPQLATIAACLLLFLLASAIILPSLGKARSSARVATSAQVASDGLVMERTSPMQLKMMEGRPPPASTAPVSSPAIDLSPAQSPSLTPAPARQVVHKAAIDLRVTDVRGTFAKITLLPNEATGEYIETSSLTGEEPNIAASLTLRVAASRLSETLNALRTLGTVISESATGQDITDTVMDLEARLRNEERIEREVLALLDKRADSPLSEVLTVRTQLNDIRARIEAIKAQRERAGRMVALATIVINLRSEAQPLPVAEDSGIADYFIKSVSDAWQTSLRTLSDTAAFLIRTFLGGLVWWLLLGLLALGLWRLIRRLVRAQSREAAPTE